MPNTLQNVPSTNYDGPLVDTSNTLSSIRGSFSNANTAIDNIAAPNTNNTYVTPTSQEYQEAGSIIKDASTYQNDKTSVANQLSALLGSNSPYMKQVDASSKLLGSGLGMLSSDRYIGAATGAAIREALPIAQKDAEIASQFGLQQQTAENEVAGVKTEGVVSGALNSQKYNLENQATSYKTQLDNISKGAGYEAEAELSGYKTASETAANDALARLNSVLDTNKIISEYNLKENLATVQNRLDTALMNAEYTQQTKEQTRAQAAELIQTTSINIEEMLRDPDILQLGSDAVADLVNNQIQLTTAGVELIYNVAGLNPNDYITSLLTRFSSKYTFEGSGLPPQDESIGTENVVTTVERGNTTTTTTTNKPIYKK